MGFSARKRNDCIVNYRFSEKVITGKLRTVQYERFFFQQRRKSENRSVDDSTCSDSFSLS